MQTERFKHLRRKSLEAIFDKKTLVQVWRKIVRNQLRSLDIKDLYDHYDFNYNIEDRCISLKNEILNGNYKVGQSLIYRIEKKWGVCRHIITPQPSDSLVLQVLVEHIAEEILKKQPSENAFYSRDKHNKSMPHEYSDYLLTWRQQWKKLQKIIYKFNNDKELIVVTDLSNYYDSIDINELRKVFTSYSQIDEVLIDLLFRIIAEISWKPDYLPYANRGLPTTNIEAIRLLAHSFLFEIDSVLKEKTSNSFTRWMDDFVIGVDTKKEAIEILSSIADMLKSRGLSLNLSKTDIYDSSTGYYHFQIEANRYIDSIEKTNNDHPYFEEIRNELFQKFLIHLKDKSPKYWDKVAKRYITTLSKFKCEDLVQNIKDIYLDFPALRTNLIYYLLQIGYNKNSSEQVINILKNIDVFDDISLIQLCTLVTDWEIPINDDSRKFLRTFESGIGTFSFKRKTPSDFYSLLWFKAKYNHPDDLLSFLEEFQNLWQADTFLRRQATAILARLLVINSDKVKQLLNNQISIGILSTVTLANQILNASTRNAIDFNINAYLFPTVKHKIYPLPKFLVLCSYLSSIQIRQNSDVKRKVLEWIKDPYYRKWLDAQYNIN